jgi:hypothetical protein
LEKRIANAETSGKNFIAAVDSIKSQKESLNGNLDLAVKTLSVGVTLGALGQSKGVMTIKGWAPTEKEILSYMESLDTSNRFAEIIITGLTRLESGGMNFTLTLKTGGQK